MRRIDTALGPGATTAIRQYHSTTCMAFDRLHGQARNNAQPRVHGQEEQSLLLYLGDTHQGKGHSAIAIQPRIAAGLAVHIRIHAALSKDLHVEGRNDAQWRSHARAAREAAIVSMQKAMGAE